MIKLKPHYIRREDTGEFFTGISAATNEPTFYFHPIVGKKFTEYFAAKTRAAELKGKYPDMLDGVELRARQAEEQMISGNLLTYFLFGDELILCQDYTRKGRSEWEEIMNSDMGSEARWLTVIQRENSNGRVNYVWPESIGALTEAPILGFNIKFDGEGDVILNNKSRIYYFEDYQTVDEFKKLTADGFVSFTRLETATK